jgi:hypothetical protein
MTTIRFEAKPSKIGSWTILRLPKNASAKLPSRGMVMVEGKINDSPFQAPLEPDGQSGHWLKVEKTMGTAAKADEGDTIKLEIEPIKEWPEPKVPADLKKALTDSPSAYETWKDITPAARWDWIRWIGSTKNAETRRKRIGVALSKMNAGSRRPCCFNRNSCTEPDVSHNGILLDPMEELTGNRTKSITRRY